MPQATAPSSTSAMHTIASQSPTTLVHGPQVLIPEV